MRKALGGAAIASLGWQSVRSGPPRLMNGRRARISPHSGETIVGSFSGFRGAKSLPRAGTPNYRIGDVARSRAKVVLINDDGPK